MLALLSDARVSTVLTTAELSSHRCVYIATIHR